ncbi:MAG TPA: cytochrome c biogenesis protein CcsA [Gemmataceae bacterium]|nr:cytochrome c biogenesis protein CcsA [Gemmataceae bacterium]
MLFLDRVTVFCFAASYAVAFLAELLQLLRPRPVMRLVGIGFGCAGLLAHTIYLGAHPPRLASPYGSFLFLAWIIAVFYLYGSLHHRKVAWGLFVLPLVLGLVGLSVLFVREEDEPWLVRVISPHGERFWGYLHGVLLLLAAVGVCVAFFASIMYLVHARRLKSKALPGKGLKLFSLERLEEMNRRAIVWAFPLLTAGVLVGLALLAQGDHPVRSWTDPRMVFTVVLWLVFAVLLYLRYTLHVRGRRVAILTIIAFVLLVVTLALPHTLSGGGGP